MSYTKKLQDTGKGYRFVRLANRPPSLWGPSKDLPADAVVMTDEQIDGWIDRLVADGKGTRAELEAAIESRIADVASGYEDGPVFKDAEGDS